MDRYDTPKSALKMQPWRRFLKSGSRARCGGLAGLRRLRYYPNMGLALAGPERMLR